MSTIEEPPYVPDYIAVCKGFSETFRQMLKDGHPLVDNHEYAELKRMFTAGISWYISGAGRPDSVEWKSIRNLTSQISELSRLGNFDYALQYSDHLIE